MNRFDRSASRVSSTSGTVRLPQTGGVNHMVLRLLASFVSIKQKSYMKLFFSKCKQRANYNKKRNSVVVAVLKGLQSRKTKSFLTFAYSKLVWHRDEHIKKQIQHINQLKQSMKTKSANLIGIIFKKLSFNKQKNTFEDFIIKIKQKGKTNSYRNKHMLRILSTIYLNKLSLGLLKIKQRKLRFVQIKSGSVVVDKIMVGKMESNLFYGLLKIWAYNTVKQSQGKQHYVKPVEANKNSRVKQIGQQKNVPKAAEVQPANQQGKKKQLEDKNRKIEQQISKTQQNYQKLLQQQKNQINDLQSEHQRLKFNNGILEEAIQDLQTEIINRQKKSRKGMPISQVWQRIYCNFLLFLKQNQGKQVPKQKILQHLQTPLVPLNIDMDLIKSQNEVLSQLIEEYRKFYEGKEIGNISEQNGLPYDILIAQNRFLYGAVEALIKQGIGTQAQIKQLQADLQNLVKQS